MHTKADLEFKYDASGNRILKIEKPRDLSTGVLLGSSEWIETYYIRDASGNIMSTYKVAGGDATWQEAHIYGSSRLGVYNPDLDLGDGACAATMDANIIYALGIGDSAADAEVNNAINSVGLSNVSSTMFGEMINGINDAQTTAPSIVEFEAYINGLIDYLCAFKCYTILNDNNFQNNLYPLINQELQNSAQMPKMDITDINSINAYWTNTAVPNIEGQLVTYYGACIADDPSISSRRLGAKQYELSNHLGNVLVTITDKKIAIPDVSNSVIEYYNAEIIMISDYYPFGMLISERSQTFATNGYRFGFNGMEQDNEVSGEGNSYDFGARIYDSRLGRWMSVDPLQTTYPNLSPYNFCGGNPILFVDIDGKKFVNPYTLLRKSISDDLSSKRKELVSNYGENFENLNKKQFRQSGLDRKSWKQNWKTYQSEAGGFYSTKAKLNLVTEKETQVNNALTELADKYPKVYQYFDNYEMDGKQINIVLFNDLVTAEEYGNLVEYGSTRLNPNRADLTGANTIDKDLKGFPIQDNTGGDAIAIELKMLKFGENRPAKSKSSLKVFLHELGHFLAETKFKSKVDDFYKDKDRNKEGGHGADSPTGDMADEFEATTKDFDPALIE